MNRIYKLLVINPGSTSTKVGYFENGHPISSKSLTHSVEELDAYKSITDQYPLRKKAILEYLAEQQIAVEQLDAVVGRGGLLKPLKGGTYRINEAMLGDLRSCRYGKHASNLGALIAYEIAFPLGIPSYIVNPVVVDELEPLARFSGLTEIKRKSAFHVLNQKAVAKKLAKEVSRPYTELNLVVAHLGGGISVAAHKKGCAVDVNNGLEEGPFSPERAGSLPTLQLLDLCFSGKYTKEELEKKLVGKGGLADYLGTADCREIEARAGKGDSDALLAYEAMAYQVAKEIGACAAVLYGKVDYIAITGGLARSSTLVNWIKERVEFVAPVRVYPGEDELSALAEGALSVLQGEHEAKEYR